MKKWLCLALFFILIPLSLMASDKKDERFDVSELKNMALQHNGRLKPLDSYARVLLLSIHHKSSYKYKNQNKNIKETLSAIDWFAELIFNPEVAQDRKVFKIQHEELVGKLNLKKDLAHLYSYNELKPSFSQLEEKIREISKMKESDLPPYEKKLSELYTQLNNFHRHLMVFDCYVGQFEIKDEQLALKLSCHVGYELSFYEVSQKGDVLKVLVSEMANRFDKIHKDMKGDEKSNLESRISKMTAFDQAVFELQAKVFSMYNKYGSVNPETGQEEVMFELPLIPVRDGKGENLKWLSPWEGLAQYGKLEHEEFRNLLKDLHQSYWDKDQAVFDATAKKIKEKASADSLMSLEVSYNKMDPFYKSQILYLIAFICGIVGLMGWNKLMRRSAMILLFVGVVYHIVGIVMRCLVMSRPPIGTLYESIIFVGAVAVLVCLIFEVIQKISIWALGASIVGVVLHFIANRYMISDASEMNDTMGTLVAVLNSNFWLATHVVCISMGYAFCFVVGVVAHIYLVFKMLPHKKEVNKSLYKAMVWLTLVSLMLTTLGTILGGIWADQSWGRFWGWDPKENGAMLIVLWLLLLTHGRITAIFKDIGFSVMLILLNIVVALAWYGVNLLNVGLHSYGFTESIGLNLAIFTGLELLLALVLGVLATSKSQDQSHSVPPTTPETI